MKNKTLISAALIVFVLAVSCKKEQAEAAQNTLTIWTYDSFTSEWGPGGKIAANFKRDCGIDVRWESAGDAGSLLSRVLLEKENANADIVLGLDQNLADRALASGLFEDYKPKTAAKILLELDTNGDFRLIPYDYSYFAFVYDSDVLEAPPKSLEELCSQDYKDKIILMDPRTSSPGLGFLCWTVAVYNGDWQDYWRRLRPSVLTVTDGWDTGYGLFLKGEAPLVLSYTTSPAYHAQEEGSVRYRAALFSEGHPMQIEYAGLLAAARNKENAQRFLDFMLTEGFQEVIPLTNWMYPAVDGIPLPESFNMAVKPEKTLYVAPVTEKELNEWADIQK
ncbi:MAG: thiamine ABC transporter substrate-binding protein [Spirochaetaceae bacterium]|jgi:thiamine transport system substrate-binding protein|nr:thiamine ABC transporter substrate-binding protein [Spirochaetaceae bacterium]